MGSKPSNHQGSEALNQRGIELADRGWLDEAVREFGRAIDLDQAATLPRINRASVYLEQGRMLEALEDLVAAVRLAPRDPATHHSLGTFLARHGVDLGLKELHTSLDLEPEHLDSLLQLGASLAERGEWAEAEQALDAALQIDPSDPLVHREKGILALDLGDVHLAVEHLRTAWEQSGQEPEIGVDLGLAFVQAGFLQKGAQTLQRVLDQRPDHLYALYNLAAIQAEQEQIGPCLELLGRALELDRTRVTDWLRDDPMFERLRAEQTFLELTGAKTPDVG